MPETPAESCHRRHSSQSHAVYGQMARVFVETQRPTSRRAALEIPIRYRDLARFGCSRRPLAAARSSSLLRRLHLVSAVSGRQFMGCSSLFSSTPSRFHSSTAWPHGSLPQATCVLENLSWKTDVRVLPIKPDYGKGILSDARVVQDIAIRSDNNSPIIQVGFIVLCFRRQAFEQAFCV